jgi:DNA-binding response OmpR family regulator
MTRCEDRPWLLLIDDNPELLEAAERVLSMRGFDVTTKADAWGAISIARELPFDVLVLGEHMSGIDGNALLRRLRESCPGLPVILLTAPGKVDQSTESSQAGVFECLPKPCDLENLVRVVRKAGEQVRRQNGCPPPGPERRPSVLLVNRVPEILSAVSVGLERSGVEVTPVHGPQEALALSGQKLFDVAVVDHGTPGMNGLELLRLLRVVQHSIEVIVLIDRASIPEAIEGIRRGAFDVLAKPVSVPDLVGKVREVFWRRRELTQKRLDEQVTKLLYGVYA